MTKRIKLFIASVVLALGFLFCFCVVSVNAEVEPQPANDETQEVVENTTNEEETTEQETENQEVEQVKQEVKNALDWFKSLDAEAVKGWLIGLVVKSGVDALVLLYFVVKMILAKTKEYKQTELWNQVIAKMDAEHQEKVENLIKDFNSQLADIENTLKEEINKLDDEKKQVAKNNIAILKDNLNDIKVDLEK